MIYWWQKTALNLDYLHPCIDEGHACKPNEYCRPILGQNDDGDKYECIKKGSCDPGIDSYPF